MKTISFLFLTLFLTIGCKGNKPTYESGLSSLEVSDLATEANQPVWTSLKVTVKNAGDKKAVKELSFNKTDQEKTGKSSSDFTLKYGEYLFLLSYADKDGKVVYETCAEDAAFVHKVQADVYAPKLNICLKETGIPVPQQTKVILNPKIKGTVVTPSPGFDINALSGTWLACSPMSDETKKNYGYGSVQFINVYDVKANAYKSEQKAYLSKDCTLTPGETVKSLYKLSEMKVSFKLLDGNLILMESANSSGEYFSDKLKLEGDKLTTIETCSSWEDFGPPVCKPASDVWARKK